MKVRKKALELLENDECAKISPLEQLVEEPPSYYTHSRREGTETLEYRRKAADYRCEHAFILLMKLTGEEMSPCVRGIRARCRPFTIVTSNSDGSSGSSSAYAKRTKRTVRQWRCSIIHVPDMGHPVHNTIPAREPAQTWSVLQKCTQLLKERDNQWNAVNPHMKRLSALMDVDDPEESINRCNPALPAWPCGWPDDDPAKAPIPRKPLVPLVPRRRSWLPESSTADSSSTPKGPRRRAASLDVPSALKAQRKGSSSHTPKTPRERPSSMPPSDRGNRG